MSTEQASPDRIERSITIQAPLDRVWALASEPGWWVPTDLPSPAANPGQVVVRQSEKWGRFPIEVVDLRPRDYAAFRWASAFPGDELTAGNATLVEVHLSETDAGVIVRVVESGFATLELAPAKREEAHGGNSEGWSLELAALADRALAVSA